MNYTYSQYCYQCLVLPLFISVGLLCGGGIGLYKFLKQIRTEGVAVSWMHFAVFFLFIALATMHIGVLKHGGIHLLLERENDALVTSGRIENTNTLTEWQFYNKYGEAVEFQIEGETYSIFSLGYAQPGDEVEITYLPESRYVLRLKVINRSSIE